MKLNTSEFGKLGKVVRKNDVYTVTDVPLLEHLVVSLTVLHTGKETKGHEHAEADEVYFFVKGKGEMQLDEGRFPVNSGDIVMINRGKFHRVFNNGKGDLHFVCVFEKYGDRN